MNEKDLVRSKVDMVALVGETVQLKRAGSNYKGLCPFHAEKSPSFMVNPEMGIFKCFGCGESGDAFSWLMKTEGMGFGEALRTLAARVGVELEGYKPSGDESKRELLLQILSEAQRFYHYLLTQHATGDQARKYLEQRKISEKVIKTFELGWAPDDWQAIYNLLVGRRKYKVEDVLATGLVTRSEKGRVYDRFRGRVIFPLKNVRGQVLGFSGRIITDQKDTPKYINSPETLVYHKGDLLYGMEVSKNAIRQQRKAVVTEGEMDMLSSWQAGVEYVVAIKGSALTENQVHLLRRYADTLVLGLDMDIAGDAAARRGLQIAEAAGLDVRVIQLSGGKDPDDVARNEPQAWKKAVNEAVEIYQFLLTSAIKRHGIDSAHGKRKIVDELVPVWREISNDILQTHWVSRLAQQVQLPEELIWKQLGRRTGDATYQQQVKKTEPDQIKNRRALLEERLVGAILRSDPQLFTEKRIIEKLASVWTKRLATHVAEGLEKQVDWKQDLPEELRQKVSDLTMAQELHASDLKGGEDSIEKILHYIEEHDIKQLIAEKQLLIARLEEEGADSQVLVEQQAVQELVYALSRLRVSG